MNRWGISTHDWRTRYEQLMQLRHKKVQKLIARPKPVKDAS